MKGLVIFLSGAVTGAAITYGILRHLSKDDEYVDDEWEEIDIENLERTEEDIEKEKENKEELNEMPTPEEIDIADRHNETVRKYVEEHREPEITVAEPVLVGADEWENCRYTHSRYQYFALDNLLIDDHLKVVTSDICGYDYVDVCERDGIAYVRNDEEEEIFEIEWYDYMSYEEVKAKFLDDDDNEIEDDIDMFGNLDKEDSSSDAFYDMEDLDED